jgi:hypothetical protein
VKKGNKGRVELYAERTEDGLSITFQDFGNYGRERWKATAPTSEEEIHSLIAQLQGLVAGTTDSTRMSDEELETLLTPPQPEPEAEPEEAEASPVPAPETVDNIEQLEA